MRMLKDNFDIHFSFSQKEIEMMKGDDKDDYNAWIKKIYALSLDPTWDDKPSPTPDLSDWNNLTAVYCVDNISLDMGLLVAHVGEELKTLSSLLFDDNQYTVDIFDEIKCWGDLASHISPSTDIIIVDQYVFSSRELCVSNIYTILRELCKPTCSEINIVFFTLKADPYNGVMPDWDDIYTKIRNSCTKKHCPRPNVTFIKVNKDVLKEHDRTIFTNYLVFSSGDTFNYFNSSGQKITTGRYLYKNSIAAKRNEKKAQGFIDDMQALINGIKGKNNYDLIIKDKKSHLLKF